MTKSTKYKNVRKRTSIHDDLQPRNALATLAVFGQSRKEIFLAASFALGLSTGTRLTLSNRWSV
jgi:hypothetical protein